MGLHPFREGNGRTQRIFIEYLAMVAGYEVDFSEVSPKEMIIASADSFACDYTAVQTGSGIFAQVIAPACNFYGDLLIKILTAKNAE